jgi:hypothetical protein
MTSITRRREPNTHQECWHIYQGETRVGTITERAGLPHDVDQWEWRIGFYPVDHRPGERRPDDTAKTSKGGTAAYLRRACPIKAGQLHTETKTSFGFGRQKATSVMQPKQILHVFVAGAGFSACARLNRCILAH